VGETRSRPRIARRPSTFDYSRVTVTFDSAGDDCVGWLYRPDRPTDAPVVVMAGGLALPRTTLTPIAERLAEAGYAAFVFDYRGVGDSDGSPRHLLSPARTDADWTAAVDRVRGLDGVDTTRLALWGHSLGGASALATAAADRRVRAVVALAPVLSGTALLRARPLPAVVRALAAGVRDRIQGVVPRLGPHTVPAVAADDTLAIVSDTTVHAAYRRLVHEIPDVPARSFLSLAGASPPVDDVACPVLFVAGTDDDVAPAASIAAAADGRPDATLLRVPETHLGLVDDEGTLEHTLVFLDGLFG
jgi:pimeloyl-ACP methyl ester carboxylesterase